MTTDIEAPIVDGQAVPSPRAQALLRESGAIASRALLLDATGAGVEVPLISGSVSCDPGSMIRRTGTLTVLGPWPSLTDPLTPYGSRMRVQRGIRTAVDTIEWITLITGPVWDLGQQDDGAGSAELTLSIKDEMATIGADRPDADTATNTALTVIAQLTAIIRRTLPNAEVIDLSGAAGQATVGALDMQRDLVAGMGKIAAAAGLEVWCGRGFQQFVVRPVPSLSDLPRWIIRDGEGGDLISRERKRTRDKVYNRVFASGDTSAAVTSGTTPVPPVTGVAEITDPADPFSVNGPLGRVTRFYTSPLLRTSAQATAAAAGILARIRGGNLETSFSTLVNPALDGGDVIRAELSGGTSVHITDSVSLPLSESDAQTIATRGIDVPDDGGS